MKTTVPDISKNKVDMNKKNDILCLFVIFVRCLHYFVVINICVTVHIILCSYIDTCLFTLTFRHVHEGLLTYVFHELFVKG